MLGRLAGNSSDPFERISRGASLRRTQGKPGRSDVGYCPYRVVIERDGTATFLEMRSDELTPESGCRARERPSTGPGPTPLRAGAARRTSSRRRNDADARPLPIADRQRTAGTTARRESGHGLLTLRWRPTAGRTCPAALLACAPHARGAPLVFEPSRLGGGRSAAPRGVGEARRADRDPPLGRERRLVDVRRRAGSHDVGLHASGRGVPRTHHGDRAGDAALQPARGRAVEPRQAIPQGAR